MKGFRARRNPDLRAEIFVDHHQHQPSHLHRKPDGQDQGRHAHHSGKRRHQVGSFELFCKKDKKQKLFPHFEIKF